NSSVARTEDTGGFWIWDCGFRIWITRQMRNAECGVRNTTTAKARASRSVALFSIRNPKSQIRNDSQGCLSAGERPFNLFGAARAGRGEHFFRAAQARGVEGPADFLHDFQVGRRKEPVHEADLLDADAVLPRHAASQLDALVEDLVA